MSHLEPEQLVLLALGEAASDDAETAHVDTCAACRAELQALRTVAMVGREAGDARHLPVPPERIWDGIAAATAATATPPPVRTIAARPHRSRRPRWLVPVMSAAAAAVVAVVAVAGTVIALRDEPSVSPPLVLGLRTLDALPPAPSCGPAYVRTFADRRVHVHVGCVATPGEAFEVWLLDLSTANDPDGLKMFTLGVMGGQTDQIFPLDSGIDLSRFNTVDVSAEPYDGKPAHSGKSLWRGPLPGR